MVIQTVTAKIKTKCFKKIKIWGNNFELIKTKFYKINHFFIFTLVGT